MIAPMLDFEPGVEALTKMLHLMQRRHLISDSDAQSLTQTAFTDPVRCYADTVNLAGQEMTAAALDWLSLVFNTGDVVEISAIGANGGIHSICESLHAQPGCDRLAQFIHNRVGRSNLYFGVQPRSEAMNGQQRRAKAVDIGSYRHALIDIDQSTDRTLDLDAVSGLLLELEPLTVWKTGGGVQALFRIEPRHDALEMKSYQNRLDAVSRDISADAVADPPRLGRLPYTINIPSATKRTKKGRDIALACPIGVV